MKTTRKSQWILANFELIASGISQFNAEAVPEFLYRGDINSVLAVLSGHHINDLIIEEPNLEEVFMHYYERE